MKPELINTIRTLRHELHNLAEISGKETRTKQHLMEFLRANTSLTIQDEGQWFCAIHEEPEAAETIAFRADMDALPYGNGTAHLCGHDGHSAVLAGLGLLLENKKLGRNVVLIFQHAEETGEGGRICCQALEKYRVNRIYAFHNIPGYDEGAILLCRGTFACASRGMSISFAGAPSHAAYPENGTNPGFAAARFISDLPDLLNFDCFNDQIMCTLVGAEIGAKAFGSAAGSAEVWVTLRVWQEDDLNMLISIIKEIACIEASIERIEVTYSFCDIFPATVNDHAALERVAQICHKAGVTCIEIPEPFRWSEDFGYYGSGAPAVMVGIGAGRTWPQLHTENYSFNDEIIPAVLRLFTHLAELG